MSRTEEEGFRALILHLSPQQWAINTGYRLPNYQVSPRKEFD